MTARRGRRAVVRHLVIAVAVLAGSVLLPGVASAVPPGQRGVVPLLDCTTLNTDGSYTAVLGYSNTNGATTVIPFGPNNVFSPATYDGKQPTTFLSGTQHGVFAVTISAYDATFSNPSWVLDGHTLMWGTGNVLSASCPPPTQLPAEGNDTGAAVALLVAGALGVIVLARIRCNALQAA